MKDVKKMMLDCLSKNTSERLTELITGLTSEVIVTERDANLIKKAIMKAYNIGSASCASVLAVSELSTTLDKCGVDLDIEIKDIK